MIETFTPEKSVAETLRTMTTIDEPIEMALHQSMQILNRETRVPKLRKQNSNENGNTDDIDIMKTK